MEEVRKKANNQKRMMMMMIDDDGDEKWSLGWCAVTVVVFVSAFRYNCYRK
jgi:hypothetical protein